MKKMLNKKTIISVLLVLCCATMCFVGGTFAKYTSTISATDSVRVAKWDISATDTLDGAFTKTNAAEVDLFKTYTDANVDVNGLDDASFVIAPGTTGTITFDLANNSEVNAQYTIDYTVDEDGVPLQWKVGDGEWAEDLADVTAAVAINMGAEETITISWKWVFDGDDALDTGLGEDGTAAPTITIAVTFTQVD